MTSISNNYLEQQKKLHQNPDYRSEGLLYVPMVIHLVHQYNVKSISNYGAGNSILQKKIIDLGLSNIKYYPYDPEFHDYGDITPADLVCCLNVLEHVEPIYLKSVLQDLSRITKKIGLFTIHTGPSKNHLSNNRKTYLIQKPSSWWIPKLCEHFEIIELDSTATRFWVVVEPRAKS